MLDRNMKNCYFFFCFCVGMSERAGSKPLAQLLQDWLAEVALPAQFNLRLIGWQGCYIQS